MPDRRKKAKVPGKSAITKTVGTVAAPKVGSEPSTAKAGTKPVKKKATFSLRAPEATQVFVAGSFNEWNPTAKPLGLISDGTWTCTLMLDPGEHEYRFVVDGVWCDDPLAERRRPNDKGCENCLIVV